MSVNICLSVWWWCLSSLLFLILFDLLEESLKVLGLLLEEILFILAALFVVFTLLLDNGVDRFDLGLELDYFLFLLLLALVELFTLFCF